MKKTYATTMPNHIGAFLQASRAFAKLGVNHGGRVEISIENDTRTLYKNTLVYAKSFADVYVGEPLVYVNSLDCMAVAINQGSFARAYNIGTGTNWKIRIRKAPRVIYE